MITHLRISHFGLIDELELALGPGLTVLTGETGAGKSLVVDAVALLRGGRSSGDLVRSGEAEARVEAQIELPPGAPALARLRDAGLAGEESAPAGEGFVTLVVRRLIAPSGRGRVYVNGHLATVNLLAEVVGSVVELAGQHEHQGLADPTTHLGLVDSCGVPVELLATVRAAEARLTELASALHAADLDERSRAEREDFLRFQLREIDELEPRLGPPPEDTELRAERERLRHAERFRESCARGEELLYGRERALVDELGGIERELRALASLDPGFAAPAKQLEEARALCEDVALWLRRQQSHLSADPERLVAVEERLDALARLLRKHGPAIEDLLRRRDEMATELERIVQHEARRQEIEAEIAEVRERAARAASALSGAREEAARSLSGRVEDELGELGMEGCRLAIDVQPRVARDDERGELPLVFDGRRLGPSGWDRVEIRFSANRGEEPRALAKTASGGELSRLMLAFKQALSRADWVRTCVFDEVDAGVGGAIAEVIGRKLRRVAEGRQLLCVTHLPQIAAFAHRHVQVSKGRAGDRTVTVARPLEERERLEEIARMLGGLTVTDTTRAHAAEMLGEAAAFVPAGGRRRRAQKA